VNPDGQPLHFHKKWVISYRLFVMLHWQFVILNAVKDLQITRFNGTSEKREMCRSFTAFRMTTYEYLVLNVDAQKNARQFFQRPGKPSKHALLW